MSNNQRSGPARAVVRTALAAAIALSFSQGSQADFVQVINVYADPFTHVGAVSVASDGRCSLIEAIKTANNTSIPGNTDCGSPSGLDHVIELPSSSVFVLNEVDNTDEGPIGLPTIASNISIKVSNHGTATIRRLDTTGTPAFRLFYVLPHKKLTIDHVTLSGGHAPNTGSDFGSGGAILCAGTLELTNSTITDNHAHGDGGAINSFSCPMTLTNVVIENNSAQGGGGLSVDLYAKLTNSTVTLNQADFDGGGISSGQGTVTLTNSTISGNSAGNKGGGVDQFIGKTTLINSTVFDNSAGNSGGGLHMSTMSGVAPYARANIINSTISSNSAFGGGGIQNDGGTLTLTNSTLNINNASNGGSAGGIYNKGTTILTNSIVANSVGAGDCSSAGTVNPDTHTLIEDGSCGAVLSGDPKLGPLTNNGGPTKTHALLAGSPAIDAGDDTICRASPINNKDQRGYSRAEGAHCDIGAYELDQTTFFVVPASNGKTVIFGL